MWAITPNPLSWRAVNSKQDCIAGEVAFDAIPDGLNASNATWDASLNGGLGSVRLMTAPELAAAQSVINQQTTGAQQTAQTLQNLVNTMTATTPFTALSQVQQTTFNVTVGRILIYIVRGMLSP